MGGKLPGWLKGGGNADGSDCSGWDMTQVAKVDLKSLLPFYFLLFFIANTNLEYFINCP